MESKLFFASTEYAISELLSQRMQSSGEKPRVTPTNVLHCSQKAASPLVLECYVQG
jgi:hypothetical protein